tara:strand:- start:581 stop:1087 length:507 start_codon:yes stop_codon:yes gene_type:complete
MIEIFRQYLEIKNKKDIISSSIPKNFSSLEVEQVDDFQINKFFYKQIGKKHRWIDRLLWTDQTWKNYVSNKFVETFVLRNKENFMGFFERIYNPENNDFEIAYFGILEEYQKKKCGGYLLTFALKNSFNKLPKRVWVHTCSLDHKNAIKNYLARGMRVFKEEKVKISA